MANVIVDDNSLYAIARAIRDKNGKLIRYKPSEMANAISKLSASSGTGGIIIGGDCSRLFAGINNFITNYGNQISTENVSNADSMFYNNINITEIPFDINFDSEKNDYIVQMFKGCTNLQSAPNLNNVYLSSSYELFYNCNNMRTIPDNFGSSWIWDNVQHMQQKMFYDCYSLRSIPMSIFKCGTNTSASYTYYNNGFYGCHSLDELKNLPLYVNNEYTTNLFNDTFKYCSRIKNVTFEMQDNNLPYSCNWKNQVINLAYVGYTSSYDYILNYNSGITQDKNVTNNTTYQALKNDPDWFTCDYSYSRYNHDSAVRTINSLPDTSSYLATAGGTNTIKFNQLSGVDTDGGAINTLTETEIAVATAKGWTVTFA